MRHQLEAKKTILITGGAGLIGRHLCKKLTGRGHSVAILSRSITASSDYPVLYWDIHTKQIDPDSFQTVDCIIHLAGAGMGDKRWTSKRKREIIYSRVQTARLIFEEITRQGIKPESFISSSATGFYGSLTTDTIFTENDPPAGDFLGDTCRQWEEAADQFENSGARVVKLRTGIVLTAEGGALPRMAAPVKYGISPVFGNGKQYLPWIHMEDLCNLYILAVEDRTFSGAYNAVAPDSHSSKTFIQMVARTFGKPFVPFFIPSFILKTVFGEMSSILLKGSRISPEKIQRAGFEFRFPTLEAALQDIYGT